jgi:anti-sigma regulatory factor (Ser/Thr protein kinase)
MTGSAHQETPVSNTTTAPPAWSRTFPATPAQARAARGFLAGLLDGHPVTDDAVLCLSELVANAAVHSDSRKLGGHFTVRAERRGNCLRVEVQDEGGAWEWPALQDDRHGHGLSIVGQLAENWGRTGDVTSWTVWFELPCP